MTPKQRAERGFDGPARRYYITVEERIGQLDGASFFIVANLPRTATEEMVDAVASAICELETEGLSTAALTRKVNAIRANLKGILVEGRRLTELSGALHPENLTRIAKWHEGRCSTARTNPIVRYEAGALVRDEDFSTLSVRMPSSYALPDFGVVASALQLLTPDT